MSRLSTHYLGKTTKVLHLLTNVILTVYFLNPLGSRISVHQATEDMVFMIN